MEKSCPPRPSWTRLPTSAKVRVKASAGSNQLWYKKWTWSKLLYKDYNYNHVTSDRETPTLPKSQEDTKAWKGIRGSVAFVLTTVWGFHNFFDCNHFTGKMPAKVSFTLLLLWQSVKPKGICKWLSLLKNVLPLCNLFMFYFLSVPIVQLG